MLRNFAISCCLLLVSPALASDYAREKRWADDVVPGLVVGDAVYLTAASGRDFLALLTTSPNAKSAAVIVHGVGVHPDHGVIGALRTRLADLGFATLSIQMPIAAAEARLDDYYPKLFPDAANRIAVAGEYLRGKGYSDVALISHSMGAWMSNVYLDQADSTPYSAWISLGVTGGYTTRMLGMDLPTLRIKVPVLDVYGSVDDRPGVLAAAGRRAASIADLPGSKQVRIEGADHFFARREAELASTIAAWLRVQFAR